MRFFARRNQPEDPEKRETKGPEKYVQPRSHENNINIYYIFHMVRES